jgi:hypothetical protein
MRSKQRGRLWTGLCHPRVTDGCFEHLRTALSLVTAEPMTGIEPAYSAWEADVLPLNYIGAPGKVRPEKASIPRRASRRVRRALLPIVTSAPKLQRRGWARNPESNSSAGIERRYQLGEFSGAAQVTRPPSYTGRKNFGSLILKGPYLFFRYLVVMCFPWVGMNYPGPGESRH